MPEPGKLNKSGSEEPLHEQELAHLRDVQGLEQARLEGVGARQGGSQIAVRYLIPGVILVLLAIGIPLVLSLRGRESEAPEGAQYLPARDEEVILDEDAVSALTPAQVATGFLDATSEEERFALVRNPETARSRLAAFPAEVKRYPIERTALQRMGAATSGEMRFVRFAVTMADGRRRLLCVTETLRGPLVDYEAFARYGTARLDDLLAGEQGEEMRLIARPGFHFQHAFTDEKKWAAFELSNPDWPANLTGYAPRGSDTAKVLARVTSGVPGQRLILRLRPEGESHQHRQVVIEKVLSIGWVRTEGDIESKWQFRSPGPKSGPRPR